MITNIKIYKPLVLFVWVNEEHDTKMNSDFEDDAVYTVNVLLKSGDIFRLKVGGLNEKVLEAASEDIRDFHSPETIERVMMYDKCGQIVHRNLPPIWINHKGYVFSERGLDEVIPFDPKIHNSVSADYFVDERCKKLNADLKGLDNAKFEEFMIKQPRGVPISHSEILKHCRKDTLPQQVQSSRKSPNLIKIVNLIVEQAFGKGIQGNWIDHYSTEDPKPAQIDRLCMIGKLRPWFSLTSLLFGYQFKCIGQLGVRNGPENDGSVIAVWQGYRKKAEKYAELYLNTVGKPVEIILADIIDAENYPFKGYERVEGTQLLDPDEVRRFPGVSFPPEFLR